MEWSTIGTVIAAIVGAIAGGLAIKTMIFNRQSKKTDIRIVSQKNNLASGDIVAGDSTKTNTKN